MKPIELVELIKKDKPQLLGKLPEKKAAALVRQTLAQIAQQIEAVDDGVVKVAGLGSFWVSQIESVKDGQKVSRKRIIFRAAEEKGRKEQG